MPSSLSPFFLFWVYGILLSLSVEALYLPSVEVRKQSSRSSRSCRSTLPYYYTIRKGTVTTTTRIPPSCTPSLRRISCGALFSSVENNDNDNDNNNNDNNNDNNNNNNNNSDEEEKKRMEMIRKIQKSYYASPSSSDAVNHPDGNKEEGDGDTTTNKSEHTTTRLDTDTGKMLQLPLWRVNWVEVPGRSNCLNVHEGHYTNMFETILSTNTAGPWYFGHLHLPGGTTAARSGERRFDLKSYRDEINDETRFDDETEKVRSAVIGTLMRISDYRRLEDGRLILLVHVLERFVVDSVIQSFPYAIADVQILPDAEELTDHNHNNNSHKSAKKEESMNALRAAAVNEAFHYHPYEYSNIELPLPKDAEYMSKQNVLGSEIAKVLPFAFYTFNDACLGKEAPKKVVPDSAIENNNEDDDDDTEERRTPTLEQTLRSELILRNPPPLSGIAPKRIENTHNDDDAGTGSSIEKMETLIWLALDDFCAATQFVLPPEILCLMPPKSSEYLQMTPPAQFLSTKYPAYRRQKRLSYTLPAILENLRSIGAALPTRHMLLTTPSTKERLITVLDRLELCNKQVMGEFQ